MEGLKAGNECIESAGRMIPGASRLHRHPVRAVILLLRTTDSGKHYHLKIIAAAWFCTKLSGFRFIRMAAAASGVGVSLRMDVLA